MSKKSFLEEAEEEMAHDWRLRWFYRWEKLKLDVSEWFYRLWKG